MCTSELLALNGDKDNFLKDFNIFLNDFSAKDRVHVVDYYGQFLMVKLQVNLALVSDLVKIWLALLDHQRKHHTVQAIGSLLVQKL